MKTAKTPNKPAVLSRLAEARASDAAWTRAVAAELALLLQRQRNQQKAKGRA